MVNNWLVCNYPCDGVIERLERWRSGEGGIETSLEQDRDKFFCFSVSIQTFHCSFLLQSAAFYQTGKPTGML